MKMSVANNAAHQRIADRELFKGSNLRGVAWREGTGYLPPAYGETLNDEWESGLVDYIVYSYGTPIAWHNIREGWNIPPVKYSRTTSRHQSTVRRGASLYSL